MKIFCFVIILLPVLTQAQSRVTNSAGAGDEQPSAACLACAGTDWNNPENISIADGKTTTTGLNPNGNCFMSTCFFSRSLYASHFNFNIPADATIDSIFVDILRAGLTPNAVRDSIVQLEKAGSTVGDNLQSAALWPTSLHYESYGHTDPLWGSSWLPEDLNDSTSGVALKIMNMSDAETQAAVDQIRMTIYYNTTTGLYSVTSSPSVVEWQNAPDEISMNIYTPASVRCASKIYNLSGQEIYSTDYGRSFIGLNHFNYDTKSLSNGIYIWKIRVGGNSFVRKFIVIH